MSKFILIYAACASVNQEGKGPSGDFMIGINLLRNILLTGIDPRLLSIVLVSTEGGAKKLAKLFPAESSAIEARPESGRHPVNIDGYETCAYSIKKAKETISFLNVVMFLSAGSCHPCPQEDLRALINTKTKVILSEGVSSAHPFNRLRENYPELKSGSCFSNPSNISFERLGFDASSFGLPVHPTDPSMSEVLQERYLANRNPAPKKFAFGYYNQCGTNHATLISNFLILSSSAPYLNRTFIFVGARPDFVVQGAGLYLLQMLQASDLLSRTEIGTSLYLRKYKEGKETEAICLKITYEKTVATIHSPTLLDKSLSTIVIDHYDSMKNDQIQGLMFQTNGPVLCTGAMSMFEASWQNGLFFYQYLKSNNSLIAAYHEELAKELALSFTYDICERILGIARLLHLRSNNPEFMKLWGQFAIKSAELQILTEMNSTLVRKSMALHATKISALLRDLDLSDTGVALPPTKRSAYSAPHNAYAFPQLSLLFGDRVTTTASAEKTGALVFQIAMPSHAVSLSSVSTPEASFQRSILSLAKKESSAFSPFIESVERGLYSQALRRLCTSTSKLAYPIAVKLFEACSTGLITLDINEKAGPAELTALHHAARKNNHKLFSLLVENGADKEAKDKEGRTPESYKVCDSREAQAGAGSSL